MSGGTGPKFSFFGKSGTFYNAESVGIGTASPKSALHTRLLNTRGRAREAARAASFFFDRELRAATSLL